MDVIERNVAFVGRARDTVEFSPKDASQVAAFLAKERDAKQVRTPRGVDWVRSG